MKYVIGFLVALGLIVAVSAAVSAVNVVVVDAPQHPGTLKVEQLPAQPSLKVVSGESIVNEDGTVNWQPAGGLKLQ